MDKDETFLKRLLATFDIEAAEHIAAISTGLVDLEMASAAELQAGIIEAVFREAHSLKGAARSVNLSPVEALCQSFEDVLASLKRKEIVPGREILDLLHRTVNLLGELLAALREGGGPIESKRIRDLLQELDYTTRKAHQEERTRANKETPADHSPLLKAEKQPLPPPVHGGLPVTAETIRVSKKKLDSILLQAEELLSLKQAARQRTRELRELAAIASGLKKDWAGIRKTGGAENKKDSGKPPSDEAMGKLLDFLASRRDQVSLLGDALRVLGRTLEHDHRSMVGMIDGLLDDVKTISMLSFSSLLEILPKVVRDLAHDRGKEVVLRTTGAEIKIDRRILDEMREPFIHLIRNCLDHGIESPEERLAKRKTPVGTIRIEVVQREGRSVEVLVSDDGTGINLAEIRRSALQLGILSKEDADRMDESKLLPLIFFSGVTTSPLITDISGRGLGLAIVQERVERLGGTIFCKTAAGEGVSFRILLPLTLATFRGLIVHTEGRQVVVPLMGLDRTVRVNRDSIKTVENKETITLDGQTVPLVPLGAVLELPPKEKGEPNTGTVPAIVLGTAEHRIAFTVDDILHEQEVLVKTLGRQLARVRNIAGATVLGTGQVVPVLNIPDLLKSAVKVSPVAVEEPLISGVTKTERKSILVVEDSITARTLLKNILEGAGYDVKSAVDGVDAYRILKTEDFGLVVSDVDMPRMNGFALTTKIRSDKKLADLPVVLVTALDSQEDRERGIEVGANAYIVKSSFDQSNLLEVIKRLI